MMDKKPEPFSESMVLYTAWQRYAELDRAADHTGDQHKRLSAAVIALGVLTIFVAVGTTTFVESIASIAFELLIALRILLTLLPLAGAALLAFTSKFQFGERSQAMRSGAEEIRRAIYFYRTALQGNKDRDTWLGDRLASIQRKVYEQVGGDLVIEPYEGPIPASYRKLDPASDPGFNDLLANDYLRYRLQNQLDWHTGKLERFQAQRNRFQMAVYAFSVLGSILAGLAWLYATLPAWVAVASSIAAALTAWMELRRMESVVQVNSRVCLELGILRDRWLSLGGQRRTGDQFFKLISSTEQVLWSHHNKYVSNAESNSDAPGAERDLLALVLSQPVPDALEEALKLENLAEGSPSGPPDLKDSAKSAEKQADADAESKEAKLEAVKADLDKEDGQPQESAESAIERISARERRERRARPHAFVVMPFGRKPGKDGQWIDFNAIYKDLIKPALELAGFEPFRADEATASGDILTDMFQELLLADLVIADMSIDNANVFYELGIRHAFRKRGIVHIQSGRAYMPFDVFNVRTLPYSVDSSGKPDPEQLYKDIAAIARMCRDTYKSDQDAVHSPVFNLLTGLDEPERKHLRTPLATGFWREYDEWQARLEVAQRQKRIGDILLLTEEISNPLIKEEAIAEAGKALRSLNQHALAIQQYKAGQAINPRNDDFRREEAFHLNRLGRRDEAIVKLEKILAENPSDSEAITYLGRIYREMWSESWQDIKDEKKRIHAAYQSSHWLVKTIHTYMKGYQFDQDDTYPGINALTWSLILDDLARKFNERKNPDVNAIRVTLPKLRGAVQFALESKVNEETSDYWTLVSLAELYVTTARDIKTVQRAYRTALTASKKNVFNLKSSIGQLKVMEDLKFRPEFVNAGRAILQEELNRITGEPSVVAEAKPDTPPSEELAFLFAGHMLDKPDTSPPVFPPEMETEACAKLSAALDEWQADANDIAITVGAAAGGDILFIEQCLSRGMKVEILLPYDEPTYLQKLVTRIDEDWTNRYYNIRNNDRVTIRMQDEYLGPLKAGQNIYERNNRWAMFSALVRGIDKVRFVALWDGKAEPNTYGAIINDMVEDVRGLGARVRHIDTTKFEFFQGARQRVMAGLDAIALTAESQPTRKRRPRIQDEIKAALKPESESNGAETKKDGETTG